MKRKIYKFVKKTIIILSHPSEISRLFKYQLNLVNAIKAPIISTNEVGEVIKTIKEESVEKASFMKVYDLVVSGEVYFKSPRLDVIKYKNSTVFSCSDFILCQGGAVWEKFHMPQFTKLIPRDQDLLKVQNGQLLIKKPSNYVNVKVGYSLCGVHSNVWAHFLVQYLPKLYLIPDIIKTIGQNITIILPKYSDPQIHDIVYSYLQKISGVEILELNSGEVAICDTLYHVSNTAWLSDHVEYISPADSLIPKFVADSLKKNLLVDFSVIDKDKNKQKNKNGDKLYIGRSGGRNILNCYEIEEYFVQKGFVIVTPNKLTLYEKIKLFRNASVIVGPLSGGFTNVIFCEPGTKVLEFANFQRIFEPYAGFLADNFDIDFRAVTGFDECSSDPHSSYTVPLSKIISACDELGI
ncbi:glycosyltransferase family 61 protein [Clostridium tagluense]|uniref:glycosyltransferase family 61 protein n=1 Tax=Clostridium tagluense TaxID=360422 RepID=UPI001CF137DC|nr:glycosyltransferase family 61 protein [Clostridium tagluense]MCB2296786.1 glycosyltransferase family 61 protein [Clostridium tagluense]